MHYHNHTLCNTLIKCVVFTRVIKNITLVRRVFFIFLKTESSIFYMVYLEENDFFNNYSVLSTSVAAVQISFSSHSFPFVILVFLFP